MKENLLVLNISHARMQAVIRSYLKQDARHLGLYRGSPVKNFDSLERVQPEISGLTHEYLKDMSNRLHNSRIVNIDGTPRVIGPSNNIFNRYGNKGRFHSLFQKHGTSPVSSHYANAHIIQSRYNHLPTQYRPRITQKNTRFGNRGFIENVNENIQNLHGKSQDRSEVRYGTATRNIYENLQLSPAEWEARAKAKLERNEQNIAVNDLNQAYSKKKHTMVPDVRNAIFSTHLADIINNVKSSRDMITALKSSTYDKNGKRFPKPDVRKIIYELNRGYLSNSQEVGVRTEFSKLVDRRGENTVHPRYEKPQINDGVPESYEVSVVKTKPSSKGRNKTNAYEISTTPKLTTLYSDTFNYEDIPSFQTNTEDVNETSETRSKLRAQEKYVKIISDKSNGNSQSNINKLNQDTDLHLSMESEKDLTFDNINVTPTYDKLESLDDLNIKIKSEIQNSIDSNFGKIGISNLNKKIYIDDSTTAISNTEGFDPTTVFDDNYFIKPSSYHVNTDTNPDTGVVTGSSTSTRAIDESNITSKTFAEEPVMTNHEIESNNHELEGELNIFQRKNNVTTDSDVVLSTDATIDTSVLTSETQTESSNDVTTYSTDLPTYSSEAVSGEPIYGSTDKIDIHDSADFYQSIQNNIYDLPIDNSVFVDRSNEALTKQLEKLSNYEENNDSVIEKPESFNKINIEKSQDDSTVMKNGNAEDEVGPSATAKFLDFGNTYKFPSYMSVVGLNKSINEHLDTGISTVLTDAATTSENSEKYSDLYKTPSMNNLFISTTDVSDVISSGIDTTSDKNNSNARTYDATPISSTVRYSYSESNFADNTTPFEDDTSRSKSISFTKMPKSEEVNNLEKSKPSTIIEDNKSDIADSVTDSVKNRNVINTEFANNDSDDEYTNVYDIKSDASEGTTPKSDFAYTNNRSPDQDLSDMKSVEMAASIAENNSNVDPDVTSDKFKNIAYDPSNLLMYSYNIANEDSNPNIKNLSDSNSEGNNNFSDSSEMNMTDIKSKALGMAEGLSDQNADLSETTYTPITHDVTNHPDIDVTDIKPTESVTSIAQTDTNYNTDMSKLAAMVYGDSSAFNVNSEELKETVTVSNSETTNISPSTNNKFSSDDTSSNTQFDDTIKDLNNVSGSSQGIISVTNSDENNISTSAANNEFTTEATIQSSDTMNAKEESNPASSNNSEKNAGTSENYDTVITTNVSSAVDTAKHNGDYTTVTNGANNEYNIKPLKDFVEQMLMQEDSAKDVLTQAMQDNSTNDLYVQDGLKQNISDIDDLLMKYSTKEVTTQDTLTAQDLMKDISTQATPISEVLIPNTSTAQDLIKDVITPGVSTQDISTQETSTKGVSTVQDSTIDASTQETSTQEASTKLNSTIQDLMIDASTQEASTQEASTKYIPTTQELMIDASTQEASTKEVSMQADLTQDVLTRQDEMKAPEVRERLDVTQDNPTLEPSTKDISTILESSNDTRIVEENVTNHVVTKDALSSAKVMPTTELESKSEEYSSKSGSDERVIFAGFDAANKSVYDSASVE